ncbi:MAG TPA: hypothetical protein ENJ43_01410 [Gammaproteobacteria bacterium]|nr:hypothetical protein [Gammaproteobacteria bacterium]
MAALGGLRHARPFGEDPLVLFQGNKLGFSVPVVSRCGVAVLDKGTTIACALRLAAKHHRDAES